MSEEVEECATSTSQLNAWRSSRCSILLRLLLAVSFGSISSTLLGLDLVILFLCNLERFSELFFEGSCNTVGSKERKHLSKCVDCSELTL